jgi:hypothetical protein
LPIQEAEEIAAAEEFHHQVVVLGVLKVSIKTREEGVLFHENTTFLLDTDAINSPRVVELGFALHLHAVYLSIH